MPTEIDKPDNENFVDLTSGDLSVFTRLVETYQASVFGYLGRMGFSQQQSEDLAQETFLRVWRGRESFDISRGRVSTWLFSIAVNVARTEFHRLKRRSQEQFTDEGESAIDNLVDRHPLSEPSVIVDSNQKIQLIQSALRSLSAEDRDLLALVYVQELSTAEASQLAGCTPGTFRTRLSRARARLATRLEETNA